MRQVLRYVVVAACIAVLLITVNAALANHLWFISRVTCNASTHTITVFGSVNGIIPNDPNKVFDSTTLDTRIFLNGTELYVRGDSILINIDTPVSFNQTDSRFVSGSQIFVLNRATNTSASTTCGSGSGGGAGSNTGGYFGPLYYDGRLNDKDGAETAAVFCMADGSVRVYALGNPWFIAFTASPAEIARVPKKPPVNTLIKSGQGAALYRLTSSELQVNSPGLDPKFGYYYVFHDCHIPPSAATH